MAFNENSVAGRNQNEPRRHRGPENGKSNPQNGTAASRLCRLLYSAFTAVTSTWKRFLLFTSSTLATSIGFPGMSVGATLILVFRSTGRAPPAVLEVCS